MSIDLFSAEDIALVQAWLAEQGELYLDLYYPHSGAGGTGYFIRSVDDLRELAAQQLRRELIITIFRSSPYPLTGTVDEALIAQALSLVPDGCWYTILEQDSYFPAPCDGMGSGQSHAALRDDLAELLGAAVRIGENPWDTHTDPSLVYPPDQLLTIAFSPRREGGDLRYTSSDAGGLPGTIPDWYRKIQATPTVMALNRQPCEYCGTVSAARTIITHAPCERCGKVTCYQCIRPQEHGSLNDYQSFLLPSGWLSAQAPASEVRLKPYMCRTCYRYRQGQ